MVAIISILVGIFSSFLNAAMSNNWFGSMTAPAGRVTRFAVSVAVYIMGCRSKQSAGWPVNFWAYHQIRSLVSGNNAAVWATSLVQLSHMSAMPAAKQAQTSASPLYTLYGRPDYQEQSIRKEKHAPLKTC